MSYIDLQFEELRRLLVRAAKEHADAKVVIYPRGTRTNGPRVMSFELRAKEAGSKFLARLILRSLSCCSTWYSFRRRIRPVLIFPTI